jgi:hypothetical protein
LAVVAARRAITVAVAQTTPVVVVQAAAQGNQLAVSSWVGPALRGKVMTVGHLTVAFPLPAVAAQAQLVARPAGRTV